ncbi:MAG: ExbD/TolR family protein [Spirochaetia bacterium]
MERESLSRRLGTRLERNQGILIAPLLDIIFLVLLFFLFNVNFEGVQSFDVHIPKAGNPDNTVPLSRIVVSMTSWGLKINGEDVEQNELSQKLSNSFEIAKTKQVLLLASEELSYKQMVAVMDQIKEAGATAISLGVEKI